MTRPNDEDKYAAKMSREQLPLRGYMALAGIYATSVGGFLAWAASRGKLPQVVPLQDVLMLGLGAHKGARILSRDKVLTFARKPVTIYEDTDGAPPGEAHEHERADARAFS